MKDVVENFGEQMATSKDTPWSLLGTIGYEMDDVVTAVSDATGTNTHKSGQSRDQHVDDS